MADVPAGSRTCKKFVEVSIPLVSVGKFCQHGLTVIFAGTKVIVLDKNGQRLHEGRRDIAQNLYLIPIDDVSDRPDSTPCDPENKRVPQNPIGGKCGIKSRNDGNADKNKTQSPKIARLNKTQNPKNAMERAGLIHSQVAATTNMKQSLPPPTTTTTMKQQALQRVGPVRQQASQRVVPKPKMNIHKASERLHQQFVGNVYEIRAVPALISYLHAAAGFIPRVTWANRVARGFYAGWPGLTEQRVRRWLTKEESATLEATTMGHQKLVSQNV